jgi:predicted ribosome quality control (RQC) complex YloA/Tae2 family protein
VLWLAAGKTLSGGYTPNVTFDALTLAAVRDELESELLGARIQQVVLAGGLVLGLEVYGRGRKRFLLCSAEPLTARVCLTEERPIRDSDTPTPLLLLLRKHVRDGRIVSFQQPRYERVLKLRVAKPDNSVIGETELIIETMGRRSNAVLVGADDAILDALRRAPPSRNPARVILPGQRYALPPPQRRLDPLSEATYHKLKADQGSAGKPLADVLAAQLAGFSPLAAREVAFRAHRSRETLASDADWQRVRATVRDLLEPLSSHQWEPTVALDQGRAVAFAPYRLTHLCQHELQLADSISQAVEAVCTGQAAPSGPPTRRALVEAIDRLRERASRRRAALQRALSSVDQAETLRSAGETILSSLSTIGPGQESLTHGDRTIELDPRLTPLKNAQRMFREYRKVRDAARSVPPLLEANELRVRHLEQLKTLAEVADTPQRLRALRQELDEVELHDRRRTTHAEPPTTKRSASHRRAGSRSSARGRRSDVRRRSSVVPSPSSDGRLLKRRTPDGLDVLVGTSSLGNNLVTFKLGKADDLWLHARGVPGAHVILRAAGRETPRSSLLYAARLAALNSQARGARRVEVDYTLRKHVRKIGGGPPGLVTYRLEKTLAVEL